MKKFNLKDIQTKEDYKEYQERFTAFMAKEKLENLTPIGDKNGNIEEYFSWHNCDCCGRVLGGNRVNANGYSSKDKEIKGPYSICVDCEYYAEYGQLDDMTMIGIDEV